MTSCYRERRKHMTPLCLTGLGVLLLFAPTSASVYGPQEQLEDGVEQFCAGYRAWDVERLFQAAEAFEKVCEAEPDDYLAYYWLGVARFHILLHRQADAHHPMEKSKLKRLVSETRKPLKKALQLNNCDSEAHGLLGTLAGMEINWDPSQAFWLGPAVLRHRRQAIRYGEDNPRTQYLLGAAFVQGPGFLGGAEKGLSYLQRAEKLFQASVASHEEPAASAPTWGHEHCLIFIGETYEHLGDVSKAEEYFRKAIVLNPHNKLAQRRLNGLQERTHGNE